MSVNIVVLVRIRRWKWSWMRKEKPPTAFNSLSLRWLCSSVLLPSTVNRPVTTLVRVLPCVAWFLKRVWPHARIQQFAIAINVNLIQVYYTHSTVIVDYRSEACTLYQKSTVSIALLLSAFVLVHITRPLPMWRWPLQFNCLPVCDNGLQ